MSTEENKELVRRFTECWNQGNLALIEEFIAPDFIEHDPHIPDVRSREDYKRCSPRATASSPTFISHLRTWSLKQTEWWRAGPFVAPIPVISRRQRPLLRLVST